jgi:hypothetical protein
MKEKDSKIRDSVFFKLLFGNTVVKVTNEEVKYFREHQDEIDEFSAPLNIHKFFLLIGIAAGIFFVGLSKFMKVLLLTKYVSVLLSEFIIDITLEIGAAFIGAAVTAYLLGILLNQQQRNAKKWRSELRKRIKRSEKVH